MIGSIKAIASAYKGTLVLVLVGLVLTTIASSYIKGRFDGADKERGKWEEAQQKKRIEQAAKRRAAEKEVSKVEQKLAETEKQGRDNLSAALSEAQDAQDDYDAQISVMDDQLFELQKIIIALKEKNVDPKIIERIKTIRVSKPTSSDRARNERLRGALNSIR